MSINRKQRRIEAKFNRKARKAANRNQSVKRMDVAHLNICNECRRKCGAEQCAALWLQYGDIIESMELTEWGDIMIRFKCGCAHTYDPVREEISCCNVTMDEMRKHFRQELAEDMLELATGSQLQH